jgi:RNA polymerase sigma factor (sigma-70 family)
MKYLLLFIILIHFCRGYKKYLTKTQWHGIQQIIKNPSSTTIMKTYIHKILFFYYNDWSWLKAYNFKKKHPYKCFHISLEELSIYASIGLLKSIRNYKGTSEFTQYATFYIDSELYNAITILHPITSIPKKIRKKQKNIETYNKNNTNDKEGVILMHNNEWLLNKYLLDQYEETKMEIHDKFTYKEIWMKIDTTTLDPIAKSILRYKFNYIFEKRRSNRVISNMLDISEETIRNKIHSIDCNFNTL